MSHYPPPYQPDQPHYSAVYPAATGAQQLLESRETHLNYGGLNPPAGPKVAHASTENGRSIHHLAQELQSHAALEEQHAHRIQHHGLPFNNGLPPPTTVSFQIPDTSNSALRHNRLRKACDSCSARKVKCDEIGPPCRACATLEIPCTFDRPSRRRGPPNRHAEAVKRRRVDDPGAPGVPDASPPTLSSPSSPTHAAQTLAALSSHPPNAVLSVESICPIELLNPLIDDYFTFTYPLHPFPHEPTFREAWKRREDLTNNSFLALLASMIGALAVSFPLRPQLRIRAQEKEGLFPTPIALADRCHKIATAARGPAYLESENLSIYDAATSFLLARFGVHTYRWSLARLYFGECATIIRTLGMHRLGEGSRAPRRSYQPPEAGHERTNDNITQEVGRRVFWTLIVTVKTCRQLDLSFADLFVPPATLAEPYPSLPVELDDVNIFPSQNEPQSAGILPAIAGFNANVGVFRSCDLLEKLELATSCDDPVDWERQEKVLSECLRRCKGAVAHLAPPFTLEWGISSSGPIEQQSDGEAVPKPGLKISVTTQFPLPSDQKRLAQHQIQRATIHASCLSTRSYIVEEYWRLRRARLPPGVRNGSTGTGKEQAPAAEDVDCATDDEVLSEMRRERENIATDLLALLGHIGETHVEPNATEFIMKLRAITTPIFDDPDETQGPVNAVVRKHLDALLNILMRLDRSSPGAVGAAEPIVGGDGRARVWTAFAEYQAQLAVGAGP